MLWLNDFNNGREGGSRKQEELRNWLSVNNVGIGDTLSLLGGLEYFQEKMQLNIHKLRLIKD